MGKKVIRLNESELIDLIHEILGDQVNEQGSRFAAIQQGFNERTPPLKTDKKPETGTKPKLKYGTYNNVKVVYSDKGLVLTVNGQNFDLSCYKYPMTQKPL
jgi:hypothetical protein